MGPGAGGGAASGPGAGPGLAGSGERCPGAGHRRAPGRTVPCPGPDTALPCPWIPGAGQGPAASPAPRRSGPARPRCLRRGWEPGGDPEIPSGIPPQRLDVVSGTGMNPSHVEVDGNLF